MRLQEGIYQSLLSKFPHKWGAAKNNPSHGVTHTGTEVCTASFPGGMGELGCANPEVPTATATWRWPTRAFWVAWSTAPVSEWLDTVSSKAAQSPAWLWEEANYPKEPAARIPLWHSRAPPTLARALEHPWSTYLLAFIQGDCFDTQFKRSGRCGLHIHLGPLAQPTKVSLDLTELHGAMPIWPREGFTHTGVF